MSERLLRRRDPEAKRARLVEAAGILFAEEGFAATSTAAIARRAGVSEGIVFHHFGSKHGLLAAVASEYGRGLADTLFEGASGAPPDPQAMLRRAFAYVRKHGTKSVLLVAAASPETQQLARGTVRSEIVGVLEEAFRRWSAEGRIRRLPHPRVTAELLFALVESALTGCFLEGDGSREEEYLREAVACIEGAVVPRAAGAIPHPGPTRSPS